MINKDGAVVVAGRGEVSFSNTLTTATKNFVEVPFPLDNGILVQFVSTGTASGLVVKNWWHAADLRQHLQGWMDEADAEMSILRHVICWQKNKIDYQGVYNAYLLGSLSEDEFEAETEKYIVEEKQMPDAFLDGIVPKIREALPIEMDDSDLASFLAVPQDAIHAATLRLLLPKSNS